MAPKRQKEIVLATVAAIALAAAAYRIQSASSGAAAGGSSSSSAASAARSRQENPSALATGVDLSALRAPRPDAVDVTRNPFRFQARALPPPPAPPRASAPAPSGPIEPPPPARIPLKFIGILESPQTGRRAVLSDDRGVYQGREGEIVEGRYRIVRIGVESIELADLDGRGRQTIRLTGQ